MIPKYLKYLAMLVLLPAYLFSQCDFTIPGTDYSICGGDVLDLTEYMNPQGGTLTGVGLSGNNFIADMAGSGLHTITYEILIGGVPCSDTADIEVNLADQTAVMDVLLFTFFCEGGDLINLTGNLGTNGNWSIQSINGTNYIPLGNQFSADLVLFQLSQEGQHVLTYSYLDIAIGCYSNDDVTIDIYSDAGIQTIIDDFVAANNNMCIDDPVVLLPEIVQIGNYTGAGINGLVFDPIIAGVGIHMVNYAAGSGTGGCDIDIDFQIQVIDGPSANVDVTGITCFGEDDIISLSFPSDILNGSEQITFTASDNGTSLEVLEIHNTIDSFAYEISSSVGTYEIQINLANSNISCLNGTMTQTISQSGIQIIMPIELIIAGDGIAEEIPATFTPLNGSNITSINWSPTDGLSCIDCDKPEVYVDEPTVFTVTITSDDGCTTIQDILVTPNFDFSAWVPNAFTPNGDNNNDTFEIFLNNAASFNLKIFDRWGAQFFETTDGLVMWSGTVDGLRAPQAVYFYVLQVVYNNGEEELLKGNVTLMR